MFRHQLYAYQEDFDFVSGTLPDALVFGLGDQLERAQAILNARNNDQISLALESLDWLLRTGDTLLYKQALASENEQGTVISRVKALLCLLSISTLTNWRTSQSLPGRIILRRWSWRS